MGLSQERDRALQIGGGVDPHGTKVRFQHADAHSGLQRPKLLLADEPTSSLDPKTSVEIMGLMRDLGREHGIPVIVNMHDVELAKRFADRIVGMSGGRIVYDGPADGLSDDVLKTIYGGESWLAA